MGTPYSAILTLMVTAGVINVIMGIYVLTNRASQSMSKTFVAHCLLSAIYIFGSALELSAGSLEEITFWIKVEYIGMPFLPPINLLLIMYFLGMDRYLKPALRLGLFLMPLVTVGLVMSNEMHHLYYQSITIRPELGFLKVDLNAGPWYIIQGAYTFGCMFGGVALLLLYWNRMKSAYRLQHITMLVGLLLPLAGDFAYLGNLTPQGIDPIPVIMAGTSALYMWALASRGLMNVAPIARDNLFESMSDGVLVLDMNNRLVDYNPAAAQVMPQLSTYLLGRSIEPLWRQHSNDSTLIEGTDSQSLQETLWEKDGQSYYYDIRVSVVRKKGGQETGKLIVLIDVSERVRLQQRLHELAFHDGLTGIYNRTHFLQLSEKLLGESLSSGEPIALLLFDIDHFKRINDTYGHDIGDRALLHVVGICRKVLRTEDVLARYGGEEFVVMMPGLSLEEAEAAAHEIRNELVREQMALPLAPNGFIAVTASFGVAVVNGEANTDRDWDDMKQLLKAADRALYEAKHAGRNTVRVANHAVRV
ncbi:histidine kinase N-terminal 7TM domain-containing protein [Paenibacillus sp. CF384]|uniref:histidine kinase N-terminal 7TM domain-containing diguanylate cyclase n=1 Tax=Paenibacillus sp. CF384 TaxID=1884382 RepID=UPI0008992A6F|nr:histidine kinase N-terminal 7TM domain-containing protein [Paenibacillus sp. CF384]SDW97110.1 PAS domain S-box-containing protein/diguanylate cyclase (GGDEF) domain-containing protein [Paenibacillus sp. CF384]